MSNVSKQHDIVAYTGKNKPLAGQVLLAYTFKTVKDETSPLFGTKPESKCASVPSITNEALQESFASLLPKLQDIIHEERRLILRDAALAAKTSLSSDDVSLSAVLTRWEAESSGSSGRFTKAVVADWFGEVLAPVLLPNILAKQGIPADTPDDSPLMLKVENILQSVLDAINLVVFSKKKPATEKLQAVSTILGKLPANDGSDETLQHITDKIAAWNKAADENLLDNLGF